MKITFPNVQAFLNDYFTPHNVEIVLSADGRDFSVILNRGDGAVLFNSFRIGTKCHDVIEAMVKMEFENSWPPSVPTILGEESNSEWSDYPIIGP
jgi:hypothetical protein